MPRPTWKGTISFGLVNVPVRAFTAVHEHTVHFHQLEKGTGARIRNQKVSDKTGKAVDADDIEMGYELRSGRYVTFEKGELQDLRPESTRAIEVTDFVALEEIDPIFYDRTYWLAPADDDAMESYRLLHAAMVDRGRVGIGTVVMRNKQYLAAIRPLEGALAMSTMRFADEVLDVADIDGLPLRKAKSEPKALRLAAQIVDGLASEWDPTRYEDTYTAELQKIIKRKDQGKEDVVEEAPSEERSADVLDLMAALEESVRSAKAGRSGTKGKASGASRGSTGKRTAKRAPARKASAKTASGKRTPAKRGSGKPAAAKKSA